MTEQIKKISDTLNLLLICFGNLAKKHKKIWVISKLLTRSEGPKKFVAVENAIASNLILNNTLTQVGLVEKLSESSIITNQSRVFRLLK